MPNHLQSPDIFKPILTQIQQAKQKAYREVNAVLVELYLNIGSYISQQVKTSSWGKGVVEELAQFIAAKEPNIQGFTARNLWRMKQFYETYEGNKKLSALLTQLSWTNNLLILSAAKTEEEREFYLRLAIKESYSSRELERQIKNGTFELKVDEFSPAYLGQLEFYLEALDRSVKKENEKPSIGVLLCRQKNDEVVEFALSRSMSPTVISKYETELIPKELLRNKLNELYQLLEIEA